MDYCIGCIISKAIFELAQREDYKLFLTTGVMPIRVLVPAEEMLSLEEWEEKTKERRIVLIPKDDFIRQYPLTPEEAFKA